MPGAWEVTLAIIDNRKKDMSISLNLLLYGQYLHLAVRSLSSIEASLFEGRNYVSDIRIGMNDVHWETDGYVMRWAEQVYRLYDIPVMLYRTAANVFKYPLMRRMFHDLEHPLSEFAMWFDDDSFLEYESGWWAKVASNLVDADMLGQVNWYIPMDEQRWLLVQSQPWFNEEVGLPPESKHMGGRRCFRFCHGAWWVMSRRVVWKYDWPTLQLRHCGGDSLFGELCRHQNLNTVFFAEGYRLNADDRGENDKSPRRGYTEPNLGTDFSPDRPVDLSHHSFQVFKTVIGATKKRTVGQS